MSWKDLIVKELDLRDMFNDNGQRVRFKELIECYGNASFFTSGVCKDMYMASFDDIHFAELLDILMRMNFSSDVTLDDMADNGQNMALESSQTEMGEKDAFMYQVSCSLLEGKPVDLSEAPACMTAEERRQLMMILKAAALIDQLEEEDG